MNLLDRLLQHDAWTTRQLLDICASLTEEQLDREFDMGHRTLRKTFDHVIGNMEIWTALMEERPCEPATDQSIQDMLERLTKAESRLESIARQVADANAWDSLFLDTLDDPPRKKPFGTAIAHVITHSMHHRAQLLYMLRRSGVDSLPEGDVFSWEAAKENR